MRVAPLLQPAGQRDTASAEDVAIVRSVLYAAVFDYPLTLAQLRQTLIESRQTPTEILSAYARSAMLQRSVEYRQGFFFPRGRANMLVERRRREARSRSFLARHERLLRVICALPYVEMVALSGSIAHMNLEGTGDLDLCIVTHGRRVWSVTVAVILLAKLLRRRATLCANFVVADTALAVAQHDLFTASQIIHLKPLTGGDVFLRFLDANPFVRRFYPNFHFAAGIGRTARRRPLVRFRRMVEWVLRGPSALAERLCMRAYRAYLLRRAARWPSPDQVRLEPDCLKLHTRSHRSSVLARYEQAVVEALESVGLEREMSNRSG